MNKFLLAAVGASLASTPALAQGAAPADGGFYIGAHVGYGWTKPDYREPGFPAYNRNPTLNGFAGGLLAGYDFPVGAVTLGLEGDVGLLDGKASANSGATYNDYTALKTKWNAHVRAKLGVPVGSVKLFAAGGLALARVEADDTDPNWSSFEKTFTGWTLGAGVEHRFAGRLTGRLEYLHDEFGRKSGQQNYSLSPSSYDVSVKPSSNLVRVALLFAL
jgi:outer membrane immunogenic protein